MKPKLKVLSSGENVFTDDVSTALSLLREALGEEEQRIRAEGARAMNAGAFDTATSVIEFAKGLLAFKAKVEALATEWETLEDLTEKSTPEVKQIVSTRLFGKKARKGSITNQNEFLRPILEVLVEFGGKATTKQVTDLIGERMGHLFKPLDFETLPTGSNEIRWRNSVKWARNTLVHEEGLMRNDSPQGVWEISDKGRKWLAERK